MKPVQFEVGLAPQKTEEHLSHVDEITKCAFCRSVGKNELKQCSRCKTTRYCSVECQKQHWKTHKTVCQKLGLIREANQVYQRIETIEAALWRGLQPICLNKCGPAGKMYGELAEQHNRKEWWGLFAKQQGGSCLLVDQPLLDMLPPKGSVLDIGFGGNFKQMQPLLIREWNVTFLDNSPQVVKDFEEELQRISSHFGLGPVPPNLAVICADIEQYQWSKVDLVVAASILPYLNPRNIRQVMENIYDNLNPQGFFVGNFFTKRRFSKPGLSGIMEEVQREMGEWFLENEEEVRSLLLALGYKIIKFEQDLYSINFVAQKT